MLIRVPSWATYTLDGESCLRDITSKRSLDTLSGSVGSSPSTGVGLRTLLGHGLSPTKSLTRVEDEVLVSRPRNFSIYPSSGYLSSLDVHEVIKGQGTIRNLSQNFSVV